MAPKTRSLTGKWAMAILSVVVVQFVLLTLLLALHFQVSEESKAATHAAQVTSMLSDCLMSLLKLAHSSNHKALIMSGRPDFYHQQYRANLNALRSLVNDRSREKLFEIAQKNEGDLFSLLQRMRGIIRAGEYSRDIKRQMYAATHDQANALVEVARALNSIAVNEKERVKLALYHSQQQRTEVMFIITAGVVLELMLIFIFAYWFKKDIGGRINRVVENAVDMARGKEPTYTKASMGTDEIRQIDEVFVSMFEAIAVARARRKELVDNASDWIFQLDSVCDFVEVNNACLPLTGYTREQLLARNLQELLALPDKTRGFQELEKTSQLKDSTFELQIKRKDATIIDTEWTVHWSSTDGSFFCIVRDISARKQAERLRSDVMQMVSHDIKSPLFTVSSFLEIAESGRLGELSVQGEKSVTTALQATTGMLSLVQNFLEIEKIEAGMLQLELRLNNLDDVIADAIDRILSDVSPERNINAAPSDMQVLCDRDRIVQVITLLLKAAIEVSPVTDSIGIKVTTQAASGSAKARVFISIFAPNGKIRENELPLLFDRFQYASVQNKQMSSSLSLAVAKAIVELHKGSIGAQNNPDGSSGGAQFWCIVPA